LNSGLLHLQSSRSTDGTTSPVHSALVVLEMGGSRKLFAQAGLEPRSS
jgi:hypothetical protein